MTRHHRSPRQYSALDHFDFLMSVVYDKMGLASEHLEDLKKSALSDDTIALQKFRSAPPHMLRFLLGFTVPKGIRSAYLIPFYDIHRGYWAPFIRMKVFPPVVRPKTTIKYLQPRDSGVRIYFPILTVNKVLCSTEDLIVCEGEKKAACIAQTGAAVVGISGCEGWHEAGSEKLHRDFDDVGLEGRHVDLWFDDDVASNPMVAYAADRLGLQLKARGVKSMCLVRPQLG